MASVPQRAQRSRISYQMNPQPDRVKLFGCRFSPASQSVISPILGAGLTCQSAGWQQAASAAARRSHSCHLASQVSQSQAMLIGRCTASSCGTEWEEEEQHDTTEETSSKALSITPTSLANENFMGSLWTEHWMQMSSQMNPGIEMCSRRAASLRLYEAEQPRCESCHFPRPSRAACGDKEAADGQMSPPASQ